MIRTGTSPPESNLDLLHFHLDLSLFDRRHQHLREGGETQVSGSSAPDPDTHATARARPRSLTRHPQHPQHPRHSGRGRRPGVRRPAVGTASSRPVLADLHHRRARAPSRGFSKHGLLTSSERYPSSILGSFSPPVGGHQQTTCDSQRNDSHDDKKQCGDPLRGQPRGDARPVSSVDCLTLSHQAHSERSWGDAKGGDSLVAVPYPGGPP